LGLAAAMNAEHVPALHGPVNSTFPTTSEVFKIRPDGRPLSR
jgi:hypothetical protein